MYAAGGVTTFLLLVKTATFLPMATNFTQAVFIPTTVDHDNSEWATAHAHLIELALKKAGASHLWFLTSDAVKDGLTTIDTTNDYTLKRGLTKITVCKTESDRFCCMIKHQNGEIVLVEMFMDWLTILETALKLW
jgi:hypothetical protein